MKIWKAQNKPIVVGLRLEDRENNLLQTAISWAAALGSPVELVHSLEAALAYSSSAPPLSLREQRAQASLEALGRAARGQVELHARVERGDPAENLARVAREIGAGLVVCGLNDERPSPAFQGISTALSLAFYATVPLLIVPLSKALDFDKPCGILINDSLGGEGWHVLESALQLARALNCDAIYHAHVLKADDLAVENTLQDMTLGAKPDTGPLTSEELKQRLMQKIKDELFYRFHNSTCCKDLIRRYHPVAGVGTIDSELNLIMQNHALRFVIMGRHQFHSNRRLALDHIPFHALIERKAAMLVIPDEWESRPTALQ